MPTDDTTMISALFARYNMGIILPRMIWLDDALLDQYEVAFPLLKKYNLKKGIVIAIPTAYVGKTFPWTDPPVNVPMMNLEQIKEMVEYGCHVASHTVTHTRLDRLSEEELRWELEESYNWIKTNVGVEPKFFVAPQDKYYDKGKKGRRLLDIIKGKYIFMRPPAAGVFHILVHNLRDDPEHKLSKRWGDIIKNARFQLETELKIEKLARKIIMR